jgi:hypothetical protein
MGCIHLYRIYANFASVLSASQTGANRLTAAAAAAVFPSALTKIPKNMLMPGGSLGLVSIAAQFDDYF